MMDEEPMVDTRGLYLLPFRMEVDKQVEQEVGEDVAQLLAVDK